MINEELKKYIEDNIYPLYTKFYSHDIRHVHKVIEDSLMLAEEYNLDKEMMYVIASFHDIGLSVDRDNHEMESGKLFWRDEEIKKYFNEEQLKIMREAIEDHRGSRKTRPRNIYGEVLSDSDRDFDIFVLARRQLSTSIKNYPLLTTFEEHFENCYNYILKRINSEGHFNLWTNNPTLVKRREKFEQDFLDKEYAKSVYKAEWDKISSDGTIEEIINYYEDY